MHYPVQPHPLYYVFYHQPFYQQPPYFYHQFQHNNPQIRQQYPDVDSTFFYQSAGSFKTLMEDASIVTNKLAEDENFANKVMDAAQRNDLEKVEKLIKSTGVQGDVEVDYNPDGINLKMGSKIEDTECCKLDMAIRWR